MTYDVKSDFQIDVSPLTWLKPYSNNSIKHILKMAVFYHLVALFLMFLVTSTFFAYDPSHEIPFYPLTLIDSGRESVKKVDEKLIEHRMIESVPISIYISHTETGIIFPNLKGEVDMNTLLQSEDPEFRNWCEDVFEYYWSQGGRVNYEKTKII